jgi:hypothetical protein
MQVFRLALSGCCHSCYLNQFIVQLYPYGTISTLNKSKKPKPSGCERKLGLDKLAPLTWIDCTNQKTRLIQMAKKLTIVPAIFFPPLIKKAKPKTLSSLTIFCTV